MTLELSQLYINNTKKSIYYQILSQIFVILNVSFAIKGLGLSNYGIYITLSSLVTLVNGFDFGVSLSIKNLTSKYNTYKSSKVIDNIFFSGTISAFILFFFNTVNFSH